jgi:hypothetical protein
MTTDTGEPDEFFVVTVETPMPEGTRRPELAYQLDEATVMRQYKPDVADPWTSCLDSALFKHVGLG